MGQLNAVEYDCAPPSIFASKAQHQVSGKTVLKILSTNIGVYYATILDGPGLKKKIKSLPGGFPGIHFTSP